MSAVADKYPVLQKLGAEVISVSVDSHFVHKMWNDHELVKMVDGGVPFHMASDQAGNVGRAFGVYDEGQGIELRGRFIIDPDGVIQAMEVLTPPVGRKFAESVRQIQAYQHVRATGGKEATPAGWMPGELTLTPWAQPRRQRLEGVEAGHGEIASPPSSTSSNTREGCHGKSVDPPGLP